MKQIRILGLAVLAVAALGALTAAAAQAKTGPFYKICTKETGKGKFEDSNCSKLAGVKEFEKVRLGLIEEKDPEEEEIQAAASKAFELKSAGGTITCVKLKLEAAGPKEPAALLGSNGRNAGKSIAKIVFEECSVTGNGTPCEPENQKVATEPVKGTLAFTTSNLTPKEKLLTLFEPAEIGGEKRFATVKFIGTGCKLKSTTIKGSVAAEDLENGKNNVLLGENETLGELAFLEFPAVPIKKLVVEEETAKIKIEPKLEAFGLKAELVGTASVKLTDKEHWGVFTK